MDVTSKKTMVPKTKSDGKVKPIPSGPSPHVRETYIKKVKKVIKDKRGR